MCDCFFLQEFEGELQERQTQIALALARAKHMTSDFTNPLAISASMNGEEVCPPQHSLDLQYIGHHMCTCTLYLMVDELCPVDNN